MGSPHDDILWYGQLERERNARVLAAAHDMLAALELVRDRYATSWNAGKMIRAVEAAIAKATLPAGQRGEQS